VILPDPHNAPAPTPSPAWKRPGVGTQTLVPLNFSAVVAPLDLRWSNGARSNVTACLASLLMTFSRHRISCVTLWSLNVPKSKCLPVLLYGLEACPLTKSDLQSLDFVINRFFMKLFTETVKYWQEYLDFSLPSVLRAKRVAKFAVSFECFCHTILVFDLLIVSCLPCLLGE